MAYLLKGGTIVDPREHLNGTGEVLISGDRIVSVVMADNSGATSNHGEHASLAKSAEVIDCTGKIIVPGLIDIHTHLRDPGFEYKETIRTGTAAAVRGGFTAVCCMPNTNPIADTRSTIEYVIAKTLEEGHCRVYPFGSITKGLKGEQITEMADLLDAGAVGFSDDGRGVQNASVMRRALEYGSMFGVTLVAHSEVEALAGSGVVNEGVISTRLGLPAQPWAAETIAVSRDIELARLTGGRIHIAHVSAKQTVEAIRAAKRDGLHVTAEVTPHHLLLTEDAIDSSYDTNLKMNPPLREEMDRQALIAALIDGTIDAIASDHAPHAPHEKEKEFELAAFGTTGLETSLSLILSYFVATDLIDYATLVERMAHGPREILGIDLVKISKGSPADITVIDPTMNAIVNTQTMESRSKNTAFANWKLEGGASEVFVAGRLMLCGGKISEIPPDFGEASVKEDLI